MKRDLIDLPGEKRAALLQQLIDRGRDQTEQPLRQQVAPHLTVERRSLLSLFAVGELEPVDAVSIGTLSDMLLTRAKDVRGLPSASELKHDLPIFSTVRTLAGGRIASFIVPRFYTQIYADRRGIVNLVNRSLKMARLLGAGCVSLTGLLASATEYGTLCANDPGLPAITTGHATTASAVVLATRDLLRLSGRELSQESVGFIGLGSVGSTALRLMLSVLGHPRRLSLCDIFQKREAVVELMEKVRSEHGYRGDVSFHQSRGAVPDELYENTLIVGATNVPDVVDVRRLRAGTLIVDDSDPHCFDTEQAFRRLEEQGDILFTEGGALRSPEPVGQLLFVPADLADVIPTAPGAEGGREITGCVLSALLSAKHGYPATTGLVKLEDALTHYTGLVESGFTAAPPHCGSRRLSASHLDSFCSRFGRGEAV